MSDPLSKAATAAEIARAVGGGTVTASDVVDAALKRAVTFGDGWMHAGGDKDELDPLLKRLQETRKQLQKDHEPFEIHVISMDAYTPDGIRKLEAQGVTDVIVGFRNVYDPSTAAMPVQQKIDMLNHYAEHVIRQSR